MQIDDVAVAEEQDEHELPLIVLIVVVSELFAVFFGSAVVFGSAAVFAAVVHVAGVVVVVPGVQVVVGAVRFLLLLLLPVLLPRLLWLETMLSHDSSSKSRWRNFVAVVPHLHQMVRAETVASYR